MSMVSLIKVKFKYLVSDFVKLCKSSWNLGINVVTFSVQLITFWELLLNTNIAKTVGLYLKGFKFK